MKQLSPIVRLLLAAPLLAACARGLSKSPPAPAAISPQVGPTESSPIADPTVTSSDEVEVRAVVEGFGQRLKAVSLLSPTATADIGAHYSAYVSDELMMAWTSGIAEPPGRVTSSPWPDRIEIASVTQVSSGAYRVTGAVIEVTSEETMAGGVAARWPVEIVVTQVAGRWVITNYTQSDSPSWS